MTKQRYCAWWQGEVLDRCCISVAAPKDGISSVPLPSLPEEIADRWLDEEYICALNSYWMERTYYAGEALPIWYPGYPGWAGIAAYLGAPVTMGEDTAWNHPIWLKETLADHINETISLDKTNRWWQLAQQMYRISVREARGKSLPTTGAFGGSGDTLASLRGSERLLFDLVDCPDAVRVADQQLMRLWCQVYDAVYAITHDVAEGSTGWFELWAPGKFYAVQNDFAYMISPAMFNNIFLPSIEMQLEFLDYAIYHVDGPGNFAHVDALCELPRLQALQILPGAGNPSPLAYMNVLKKVQAADKNLHISIAPDEVKTALENLSIKGLFIQSWCDSETDARILLSNVEKWSARKTQMSKL